MWLLTACRTCGELPINTELRPIPNTRSFRRRFIADISRPLHDVRYGVHLALGAGDGDLPNFKAEMSNAPMLPRRRDVARRKTQHYETAPSVDELDSPHRS